MTMTTPNLTATMSCGGLVSEGISAERALRWSLVALGLFSVSPLLHVSADPDLWGHLTFGLQHLRSGRVADGDPYSYTALGHEWINHEWLCEWLFGACYSVAGSFGLLALRGVLFVIMIGSLGTIVARRRPPALAVLAWGAFAIAVIAEFYRLRPQMFTYACMALLLLICDQARAGRLRALWLVPLLILVWTNLHAGFVAGLGILGVHLVMMLWQPGNINHLSVEQGGGSSKWDRSSSDRAFRGRALFLVAVLALSVLATFVNPYGPSYWRFVLFAITLPRPGITEWGPIWQQNNVVLACYVAAVLVPIVSWWTCRTRLTLLDGNAVVFVLGALLAGQHARHLPFLLLFGTIFLVHSPSNTKTEIPWTSGDRLLWGMTLAMVLLISAGRLMSEARYSHQHGLIGVSTASYPVDAVRFMKDEGIRGNLDCGFTWGEYCIFHLYPNCRVFCDGRYETCYPREISDLVLQGSDRNSSDGRASAIQPQFDSSRWRRRSQGFGTDVALLPIDDPFGRWLERQPDFAEVYRDATAKILVRRGPRTADRGSEEPLKPRPLKRHSVESTNIPFPG